MEKKNLIILAAIMIVYLILDMFIPFGGLILYPIKLFVTFLHEFGHAFGNVITGGDVISLQVNADGSGATWTSGGSRAITIMGGYLGSAIFGNLLLYLGVRKPEWAKMSILVIAIVMMICSFFWFSTIFNMMFILLFASILCSASFVKNASRYVLMFLGGVSVINIITDFNVGPSSDLNAYAEVMGLTQSIWMFIWLGIVLAMTSFNVKNIIK